jgi:hypothetical protein
MVEGSKTKATPTTTAAFPALDHSSRKLPNFPVVVVGICPAQPSSEDNEKESRVTCGHQLKSA